MREARRNNLLILFALAIIAGTLALYATLLLRWLSSPSAPPEAVRPSPRSLYERELTAARSQFREQFLQPAAAPRLAEALRRAGRPVDAFYVLLEARALFGEAAFARAHAAVILGKDAYLGASDYDPSPANEQRLKSRLKEAPESPELLAYLARVAADRGAPAEAGKYLEQGLSARPEDRVLLLLKARLAAASDPIGSITLYARLANAAPDSYEGRSSLEELGRLAAKREEGPEGEAVRTAREALDELVKARPDHPLVFSTLAMSFWSRGDLTGTRALVAATLARRPVHAGAAMIEGALALFDRDADKAIKRFTDAWEKNPDDLYSAEKLAQLYYKQRADAEAALPFYLALFHRNPGYNDGGRPAEQIIRETIDARREQLLKRVGADGLGRYLKESDASLRAQACVRAADLKDPRWIDALAELLDDDTDIVRHNADYALYQIARQYPDALRVRRDDWLANNKPLLRARVLNLFADLYPQETFPLVLQALGDPNPVVRYLTNTMILDHYYKELPAAAKARAEYLKKETDPNVLAMFAFKK